MPTYEWKSLAEQTPDLDRTILVKFPEYAHPFYASFSSATLGLVPFKSPPGEVWYVSTNAKPYILWTYSPDPYIPLEAEDTLALRIRKFSANEAHEYCRRGGILR
jgi:hypothetical protein